MDVGDTSRLEIRTPEGVVFSLPVAGPVVRAAAWLIDLIVIGVGTWLVSLALTLLALISPAWMVAAQTLAFFLIQMGYGMVLEWLWNGQTIGKKVMKLRVADDRGLALRPSQVVVRNLLRLVDFLPTFYVVGGVSLWVTRHCQRLGDLAAGTVVLRTPPARDLSLENLQANPFNSFRAHPLLEARLRHQATPEEVWLALSALRRRDELEPSHRLRVFGELAAHFRQRVAFPDAVVLGLSDEQYVRNVVDSVFRARPRSEADK